MTERKGTGGRKQNERRRWKDTGGKIQEEKDKEERERQKEKEINK